MNLRTNASARSRMRGGACVVLVLALVAVAAACEGPPQSPGSTPSGCQATLSGKVVGGSLVSGSRTATVNFPAGAEIAVTGTVKDNMSGFFAFPLPWELHPIGVSGAVPKNSSATVDETWTNGSSAQDVTLSFEDTSGFVSDYEWELHLSSSGDGCPPATAEACIKAGGNVFYTEPTVVDGEQRQGCYEDDSSCIDDLPVQLSATECDPNDIFTKSLVASAGAAFVVVLDDETLLLLAGSVSAPEVGVVLAATLVVTAFTHISFDDLPLDVVRVTDDPQTIATVQADPGVINDVMTRLPTVAADNPGYSGEQLTQAAQLAMENCVRDIALDEVISWLGGFGSLVDPITGLIDMGGGVTRHVCELFKVYEPGGSTAPGGASMISASLHIRDVLYGEHNGVDTQTGNPTPPQIQWQILTRATSPTGSPTRGWYKNSPYYCQGSSSASPPTGCDEWPWYRTAQGGPGAHLRVIDGAENSNGGSDLGSFYATCNVSVNTVFLVVPLSAAQITNGERSIRLCP